MPRPLSNRQTDGQNGVRHHRSVMDFTRFHLRGIHNVAAEWSLVALAYNYRRINRIIAA